MVKNEKDGNKSFYITTPIFYPNADLHLGHAYTSVISDTIARYHRQIGDEVYFLTGTDDHASKVAKAAEKEGEDPKPFVNKQADKFRDFYSSLNVNYDDFIQTSDQEKHWPGATLVWNKLLDNKDLEKRVYKGLYCVGCEAFVTEKDLDEDGNCPHHNTKPEELEEENWFFKLSKYNDYVKELISSDELKIVPESRKNEILSLLDEGLEDISFSRSKNKHNWGIPVPNDDSQTMYVWCDALVNYISALGYGLDDQNLFDEFWPANVHVVGKDILRFHSAIWPAMLKSVGIPAPKSIFAHGFITSGGKKMSKTIGNVIDPKEIINEYGTDALRYYLVREINPFEDGDFTLDKFKEVYNANLANGIGNLTSRILKMSEDHLENVEVLEADFPTEYKGAFDEFNVQKASDLVWSKIGELDQKIQDKEPFKLIKEDEEKAKEIIKSLVQGLYEVALLLEPLLPDTAEKIKEAIKENKKPEKPLFERKD